jgi:hypothetical protein
MGRCFSITSRSCGRPGCSSTGNDALQRSLAYSPIYLTDAIQLSDDPFPTLRAAVYALSVQHRGPAAAKTN